jgi:hypothetical protein
MSNGLFTSGSQLTVEQLLQQRAKRDTDLQRQLMASAAQGARDPMRAKAASFLGSALGRALAGVHDDPQLEKVKAAEEKQAGLQGQYADVVTHNDPKRMLALGNQLIKAGYAAEGVNLIQQGKTLMADAQDKAEEELAASITKEDNYQLAEQIRTENPRLAAMVEAGRPEAIKLAVKSLSGGDEATVKNHGIYRIGDKMVSGFTQGTSRYTYGPNNELVLLPPSALYIGDNLADVKSNTSLTAAEQNQAALMVRYKEIEDSEAQGLLSSEEAATQKAVANKLFAGYTNPAVAAVAKERVANLTKFSDEIHADAKGASEKEATLRQSLHIVNSGLYTGVGEEFVAFSRKTAIAFGLADKDTVVNQANAEQLYANSIQEVLGLIEQTKGAITERENTMFMQASHGLSKTVEGNRIILETALKVVDWKRRRSDALNHWVLDQQDAQALSGAGARDFIHRWEEQNKINLRTSEDIKTAQEGKQMFTTAGNTKKPAVTANLSDYEGTPLGDLIKNRPQ